MGLFSIRSSSSCVLPVFVIAFSYIMTARHLVESSEGTQNPRLNERKKTAKILFGLTLIFLISYVPFHILQVYFYSSMSSDSSNFKSVLVFVRDYNVRDIIVILNGLLSLNFCLNPVALFCTSLSFRRRFKRYLTCCCNKSSPPPNNFERTKIS